MSQGHNSKNRIVVGVELSESGDHALREGMRLAKQLPESELHVTSVIQTDGNLHDKKKLAQVSNDLRGRADELRQHVASICAPGHGADAFAQDVVFHVRIGEPVEALIQVAVDVDADMIVVGTHGRRGVERWMLGSVAEALIRSAPLPVVIAHPKDLSGLRKTPQMDAAQPGDDFHTTALSHRVHLEFAARGSHIAGLL